MCVISNSSVFSGGNNVYYTVRSSVVLSVTKVKGSALLTLCVLLQGSKSIESGNQLALVLYNPNNQSSNYGNFLF